MALGSYFGIARAAARPADNDNAAHTVTPTYLGAGLVAGWDERVTTAVAVSAAVAVVALIALLMASIGP